MCYTKVENDIIRSEKLKPNQKVVLIVLSSYFNKSCGYAYPSLKLIMQKSCIKDKNTIIKILKELERMGYIRKETVKGVGNKYYMGVGE